MSGQTSRVVVVGAGIHGLCAAWNLVRLGARDVVLVERFRIGHDRGSSHGTSRITRTSYASAAYARLVVAAQREDWPRLERDAGLRLVHPTPGLFFGPSGGQIDAYERAVAAAGCPVDRIDVLDARRAFPQFAFPDDPTVLVDRSAGVIAASETIAALARLVRAAGVDVREDTEVLSVRDVGSRAQVETSRGTIDADCAIVTAGAWVRTLVPTLAARLSVARQTACYFATNGAPDVFRAPRFPVWVWLGRDEHDHFYGVPEFGRPGIKAARHRTSAGSDDPDAPVSEPSAVETGEVLAFLCRELSAPPRGLIAAERCLYTNEPSQDFVVGPLPGAPRVIVGAACSGHAFKFGPLVGRVLAETALHGRTSCDEFRALAQALV
ncbi:MAG: FAD-dependent oxidoreductase [Planctomycetes bacterium]|nr:FAD-dependent oxidoreductase [Planctomycetota bacterium]